ncbi:myosin light chain kinase: smooth muscle-like protein [Leptotrombidium deliense]|uniref:Myosin light chain kinase: smooth muscle-like protein n=1 Tax=Leptotrombidium deliense TaxID=299467 RepID=A0A443SRQ2_9ACAR|nr:myosin light chain kinase: smooth muscle-like protein [Leptotrombidium deliense]
MIRVSERDSDDEGNGTPFVARKVVIKRKNPKTEYNLAEELGRGKFGVVYKCTSKDSKRAFAAKFVTTQRKEDREDVERELDIMCTLQHRRLLQLFDAYDIGNSEMCLIVELYIMRIINFVKGGELFERVICDDFILTEKSCIVFMRQICEGPENILCVTRSGNRIKIIDFGLARRYNPNEKLQVLFGTPEFVAPEVVNFDKIGPTTDMWSVGVICYVLLSGLSPFMGESDLETMANVTSGNWDFEDESFDVISDEAKDFIEKLLVKDKDDASSLIAAFCFVSERLTATQCLNHSWLKRTRKMSELILDKSKLRKFVIRRRWQKAVLAILALKRMGASLAL